jgi:hypothetical protein
MAIPSYPYQNNSRVSRAFHSARRTGLRTFQFVVKAADFVSSTSSQSITDGVAAAGATP